MTDLRARKASHLDLCASDEVAFNKTSTLFEAVHFAHDALPELDIAAIDLRTSLVDRPLRAPLLIAAMTGGIDRAESVNRALAAIAEELGLGFGFGSMRPLLQDGVTLGYRVRDVAPTAVLLGNLGVVQARDASDDQLLDLVGRTDVNALALHLNPAQEVIQEGGDTDFRGCIDTFARVSELLPIPIIAKETGCGISAKVGRQLEGVGVRWVDVGGAGGTSWVGVETLRARAATERLGRLFWDWGLPTAASLLQLEDVGLHLVATGGVKSGLDLAKAIALGAKVGGMARPFLMALNEGGQKRATSLAREVLHELRVAMLLTGSANLHELRNTPRWLDPQLERWRPANRST